MPDGGAGQRPEALHDFAVAETEAWLREQSSEARRLEAAELRAYAARAAVAGWRVPVRLATCEIELDLIVDRDFPWAPPRIALVGETKFGAWPHAEHDNVVCLDEEGLNPLDPAGIVATVLNDAIVLVQDSIAGVNRDDFLAEFETYWTQVTDVRAPPVYMLMRPGGASRLVRLWRDARHTVVAEDDEALELWLKNATFIEASARMKSTPALAVSVAAPPMPEEYPRNGVDVIAYLRRVAPDAATLLAGLADPSAPCIDIIIMANNPDDAPVAAAMVLMRPRTQSRGPGRAPADPMTRGFRDALPHEVALARYTGGVYRTAAVERADRDWIHGRDADDAARRLAEASVVILGGGSVGAPTALSLAHAGVGEINVVDEEALKFGNIGRHPLGAPAVRKNKAVELVAEMKRKLPHLKGQGFPTSFQAFRDGHHEILAKATLIVSAMGDWPAEAALNAWRLEQLRRPPVVFGWAEEHACAGHAVAIVDGTACLACGMAPTGAPRFRVTRWPKPTLLKEPGCGAHFQPYGQIEISRVADTVAELAIAVLLGQVTAPTHRVWAASEATLKNAGGDWTPEWLQACGGRTEGGFLFERRWGGDVCWQCGRRAP